MGDRGLFCSAHRRLFDPKRFHVVLFDQRGYGQSRPYASLDDNSTDALIGDIEALRQSLILINLFCWWIVGQHVGVGLSIAYPEHVSRLILRGVF